MKPNDLLLPDCRLCHYYAGIDGCFNNIGCTEGDKYKESQKVVLWRRK